jgi:hypothetical protein
MNALYEIELAIHAFFLQIYFLRPNKKAKPALCFARIAKAILDDVTLHNSSFLLIKENSHTNKFSLSV